MDALRIWLESTPMGLGMAPEMLTGIAMATYAALVLVGVALAGMYIKQPHQTAGLSDK